MLLYEIIKTQPHSQISERRKKGKETAKSYYHCIRKILLVMSSILNDHFYWKTAYICTEGIFLNTKRLEGTGFLVLNYSRLQLTPSDFNLKVSLFMRHFNWIIIILNSIYTTYSLLLFNIIVLSCKWGPSIELRTVNVIFWNTMPQNKNSEIVKTSTLYPQL